MKKSTSKNYLLALLLMVSALGMKAQNLVINPSFETFTPPPIIGCAGAGYGSLTNWYNPDAQDSCSTPDWYSNCAILLGATPNASYGYQTAHSGNAYAGIILKDQSQTNDREYVEGKLSSPLVAGQTYCVAFHVSLANKAYKACNNIGMYLSNTLTQYPPNYCRTTPVAPLSVTPQLNYTCTVSDTANWVRLQWNYTATGGEQYFTIGNFFNDATTTTANNPGGSIIVPFAYYYIDDVSIAPGVCCYDSIIPQPPLCISASSVTLTTSEHLGSCITPTNSGVWSGTGITNTTTGVFDPAIAGVGTHVISYSLSCGYVATTSITVNSCATLTVCQSGTDYNVSGGTPSYTWSTWNPGGSIAITTQAQCLACNSSYTWFGGTCLNGFIPVTSCNTPAGWQQYATGATITSPNTYPILVQDAGSGSYTITSSSSTPTCAATSTCTPITVATAASNSVTCFGASTGSATVSISPAGTYTTTWQPGGLVGISQSGLAAGVYTVTADAGGGCTGTTTVSITQATAISNTIAVTNATCNLSNGSATVTTGGGTGAYTYTWSPIGGNGATASNIPAGVYTLNVTDANTCTATATTTISTSAPPTITIVATPYCPGDSTILTASGATSSYTWAPATALNDTNTASVTATPTTTTIYTVSSTTGACLSTSTISVGPLTFTVNKVNLCKGDSATLIASNPNLTYSWTPATGLNHTNNDTVKASPASTTVYTITGTYGATCSLTVTDSVIVLTKPIISVLSPTVCSATSATITATGAATYTWVPASGLSTSITSDTAYVNMPTTPGTFTVVGSAPNGCTDTAVSHVTISNHLGILSGTPINSCHGDYLSLTAIGASTYTWTSNDVANLHFSPDTNYYVVADIAQVGSYTVAIYGESHSGTYCNGYDTVTITIHPTPTLTAVAPTATNICAGSSVNLTASSFAGSAAVTNFTWTPATGLSVTSVTNNAVGTTVATPPNSTLYSVTGYNQYGCADTKTYSVTVIPIPTFNLNSATICPGTSATLTATQNTPDAATYNWSPSASLSTNTGTVVVASPTNTTTPTVYTVTATTTVAGCHSLPQTTTVTVRQQPTIVAATQTIICSGDTVTLAATTNLQTYNWQPTSNIIGATNTSYVSINPTTATMYTVSGTDAFGCQSNTLTINVGINPIHAAISANPPTGDMPLSVQFANTSVDATTYYWNYGNGNTTYTTTALNDPNTNTIYTTPGTYTVTMFAINAEQCTSVSTLTILVYEGFTITIPNVFTPNGDNINDNFFVKSTGLASIEMVIFDRWGLKVWESSSGSGMWNGGSCTEGTYFYVIKATSTKNETKEYKGPILLIK